MEKVIEAQYDKLAKKYEFQYLDIDKQSELFLQIADKHLPKPDNNYRILDCSCGTGLQTIALAKAGYHVVGSDISQEMLNIAKNNAKKQSLDIEFIRSSWVDLENNTKGPFDAVICWGSSICHCNDQEHMYNALKSMYDLLNTDGVFLIDSRDWEKMLEKNITYLFKGIREINNKTVVPLYNWKLNELYKENKLDIVYMQQDKENTDMDIFELSFFPYSVEFFKKVIQFAQFKIEDLDYYENELLYYVSARK